MEQPAREKAGEIAKIVTKAVKNGATIEEGLLLGGLRLQREAQLLTPVDTSALKASAFTVPTRDENAAIEEAFSKSESIRLSEMAARKSGRKA